MKVYKLRNKETGMYHSGGSDPSWGGGKSYGSRRPCVTLINQWAKADKRARQEVDSGRILSNFEWWLERWPSPEKLEVVEFELSETECNVYQGSDLVK